MIINLFILLLSYINVNFYQQQTSKYNAVEFKTIQVKNEYNKVYSFGSAKQLQEAFGKVKPEKQVDEVLEGYGYTYRYAGLEVYFHEKDFEEINIVSPNFKVFLNGQVYRVGDNINKLKGQFPIAYKDRRVDENKSSNFYIGIALKKKLTDSNVFITSNNTGIITSIWIGNNNS